MRRSPAAVRLTLAMVALVTTVAAGAGLLLAPRRCATASPTAAHLSSDFMLSPY